MTPRKPALILALASAAAILLPSLAQAHCPRVKPAVHKIASHAPAKPAPACNCAAPAKPPTSRTRPRSAVHHMPPPAPPPIAHAPYVDTQPDDADYGPAAVVDLNTQGWETSTYTSSRIISRRTITYQTNRSQPVQYICRCRIHCAPH